jgi:hypothetical protein
MKNKTMAKFVEFAEKWDNILFIFGLIIVGILLFGIANAYACSGDECKKDSNVADINDGNKGYIFTYYCEKGNESLGKWVDPKNIPELKGEQGEAGKDGQNGLDGYTPTKGVDYFDGKDGLNGIDGLNGKDGIGIQGDKGDKGDIGQAGKDVDPALVTDLQNTDIDLGNSINTETNNRIEAFNLQNETNARQDRTLQDHESRIGTLEETQYNVRGELKFIREKNFEVGVYSKYNTNRNVCSEVGLSITIGIGKSWTERELDSVNKKVAELQKTMEKILQKAGGSEVEVEKVKNKDGSTTFSLNKNGTMKVLRKF